MIVLLHTDERDTIPYMIVLQRETGKIFNQPDIGDSAVVGGDIIVRGLREELADMLCKEITGFLQSYHVIVLTSFRGLIGMATKIRTIRVEQDIDGGQLIASNTAVMDDAYHEGYCADGIFNLLTITWPISNGIFMTVHLTRKTVQTEGSRAALELVPIEAQFPTPQFV